MNKNFLTSGLALIAVASSATLAAAHPPGFQRPNPTNPTYAQAMRTDDQAEAFYQAGDAAMRAKDFTTAEADFRACISINPLGAVKRKLAEVLTAEGRIPEALQEYQAVIYPGGGHGDDYSDPRCLLNYAILLNRTGQWDKAVFMYEKALPTLPGGTMPQYAVQFDPDDPQSVALEAAAYVGLGLDSDFRCDDDVATGMHFDRAVAEFGKALALEPSWGMANYYYGYGLRKMGRKTEAQAAFKKAASLDQGNGDVKAAAEAALAGR